MTKAIHSIRFEQFQLPLVVDVSSNLLQLGIPSHDAWDKIVVDEGQAMQGLFRAVNLLFEDHSSSLNCVDCIFFCSGPGSTLGIRIAAAFVKTVLWQASQKIAFFQYNALDLAACMIEGETESIQAPYRLGKRFVRTGNRGQIGDKIILDEAIALQNHPESLHLTGGRPSRFETPPKRRLQYLLEKTRGLHDLRNLCEVAESPMPYTPEPTVFRKWDGIIPSKTSASSKTEKP